MEVDLILEYAEGERACLLLHCLICMRRGEDIDFFSEFCPESKGYEGSQTTAERLKKCHIGWQ